MDKKWTLYLVQGLKNKILSSTPAENKTEENESNWNHNNYKMTNTLQTNNLKLS